MINKKIDAAIDDKTVRYVYNSNVGTAGVVLPAALLKKGVNQWNRIGDSIRGKNSMLQELSEGIQHPQL